MAPILKKTAKKPPKVKKTYQNTLGSEKMWFNVIKNTARNRAYQSFIRSFILYDRVSLRPEDIERVEEGDEVKVRWYTPNGAWYWEFFIGSHRDAIDSILGTTIKEHEPHTFFITNATREEYPGSWQVFSDLYSINRDTIKEKLYEDDEEEEERNSFSPFSKRVMRKLIEDFTIFKTVLVETIVNTITSEPMRRRRALGLDIGGPDTRIRYNEVRKKMIQVNSAGRGGSYSDNLAEVFRIMTIIYSQAIRKNNPNIVWENFVNLCVEFRREYIYAFRYKNPPPQNRSNTEETIMGFTEEEIKTLSRNVITSRSDELENLIDNLPDYD